MAEELPICGPPDWNAPATMSAGVLLFAMSFRAERMYWNQLDSTSARCRSVARAVAIFPGKVGPLKPKSDICQSRVLPPAPREDACSTRQAAPLICLDPRPGAFAVRPL